jgi:hypothetical protein
MAWVELVQRRDGKGRKQPSHVTAFVKVFDFEGRPVVQIDTLGSADRANPGKQSQTLQLGREAAEQLYRVLADAYGFKS